MKFGFGFGCIKEQFWFPFLFAVYVHIGSKRSYWQYVLLVVYVDNHWVNIPWRAVGNSEPIFS